ncbi:hypothetical protein S7335_993 [Synechococcus sp. PCC 7335]|uniref:hypothetical protein n=1 Tax=Synechococcus sp. (strain ATCC 29403 / PCC 7335) TaxID=91464 RepID=UPI00017EC81A|nr:hypothetical protein [Synechococcus sp. PCC 7335]EDX82691.1 hypothetical protein S7335_993 [Synechococcus sp. PCC 7335]
MSTNFTIGQLVKVADHRLLSFGRFGYVSSVENGTVAIEFADLPVATFKRRRFCSSALEAVTTVPIATSYLMVTIRTVVANHEMRKCYAIAHVEDGETGADVAETIAAKFFGSLGEWDGDFYRWENSQYAAKLLSYRIITAAEYDVLSMTTPDYCLGAEVSSPF